MKFCFYIWRKNFFCGEDILVECHQCVAVTDYLRALYFDTVNLIRCEVILGILHCLSDICILYREPIAVRSFVFEVCGKWDFRFVRRQLARCLHVCCAVNVLRSRGASCLHHQAAFDTV
jgi:hypothetical protein